ncbi:MAG: FkbM family methyltransferase [Planctomycetota bacterium]|jgi:FkbM family methyltransferase
MSSSEDASQNPSAWIYDIGMHHGEDTDFYLKKGFKVVAVEANPALVQEAEKQFASEIKEGRLKIVNAAIAAESGPVKFYVNKDKDDWSSIYSEVGGRDGSSFFEIEVPGITAAQFFAEHHDAYYVKIDIEHADVFLLQALHKTDFRPRFLSIEAHALEYLGHLTALGYEKFKLINQNMHWSVQCPSPPLEGEYVKRNFSGHSSGPFGEETAGEWVSFEEVADLYLSFKKVLTKYPHIDGAWFDFHAKFGD